MVIKVCIAAVLALVSKNLLHRKSVIIDLFPRICVYLYKGVYFIG